jgi:hypothetical protein
MAQTVNYVFCRSWIFSIFVPAIFRYMFGLLTVHFFRHFVWCPTLRAIYIFSVVSWWFIPVFFGDRRWMLWQMCNMKLLIILVVSSCQLFRNGVGRVTIITSKFCGLTTVNFLDLVPYVLLINISIFVGPSQWFIFVPSSCPERVNYQDILLLWSWGNFSILYLVPQS